MRTSTQKRSGAKVGFVRDTARHKIGPQRKLQAEHGVKNVHDDLDIMLHQLKNRPGDIVTVAHLYLLARPEDATKLGGLPESAMATMDELDARAVAVLELSTGLNSIYIDERAKMRAAMIAFFQRSRARSKNKGAPPKHFTDQERSIIEPIWLHVVKYPTNNDAAKAANAALEKAGIKRRVTAKILSYRLGPSGRGAVREAPKRKSKRK